MLVVSPPGVSNTPSELRMIIRKLNRGLSRRQSTSEFVQAYCQGFPTEGGTDGMDEFRRTSPSSRPVLVVANLNEEPGLMSGEMELLRDHSRKLMEGIIDEEA